MTKRASYIYSAYSFIHSLPEEQITQIGNLTVEGNPIPSLDEDLLIGLCEDATQIFKTEENIIDIDGDSIIVGDIHGSFHDLIRIIRYIEKSNCKVIFLGDYVDRGNFSLECITLLFCLKILKPDTFILLRGNHEFNEMCAHYGFKKEILNYHDPNRSVEVPTDTSSPKIQDEINFDFDIDEKEQNQSKEENYFTNYININCYKYTENLYNAFMTAFSYMPICSIINKTSICIHGGLSPLLDKIENINKQITRPINEFEENLLLSDILWGDPSPELQQFYSDNQRGRGKLFNGPVVVNFLKNNNLKRLIRGHECVRDGVEQQFNEKCITVFSASSYSRNMGNLSGILKVIKKDDKIEPVIFNPLERLKKCDTNYYKVESFEKKETTKSLFPKISNFKSAFILPSPHLSPTKSDHNLSLHYHTSKRNSNNSISENDSEIFEAKAQPPERKILKRNSLCKIPQLNFRPRKRLSCVCNSPQIFIPQVANNNTNES